MTDNIAVWYAARATGLVALLLLTATMLWGMLGPPRTGQGASAGAERPARSPRFVVTLLHRNLSLLTLSFLGVHIGSSIIDTYAGIGWLDAVIPFGSTYRPMWLGFGAVAFDLLLAVLVTSLLRARISLRLWRGLHWFAYLCWPLALVHALGVGTDSRGGWPLVVTLLCCAAVAVAGLYRLSAPRSAT
ncbi:MAG TPA: ferric reductase [Micromonosporaceae bacterium]|jgi:DMSO/TMAO reductase YedYZ heme-binding membrane subunit